MFLSRLSITRPVFVTMVVTMFMVMGLIGLSRLPVQLFPDVSIPVLTAIVPYPGASPAQVEEEVVQPIEDAVAGLAGLDEIFSFSRENVGIVVLRFDMDADVQDVANQFRDRVYGLRAFFPDGVDDPIFRRVDPAATPVLTVAVSSTRDDMGPIEVREYTERFIKPRIEQVDGVGGVTIQGGETREIQVEVDLPKLAELRIPFMQVIQLVGYDTIDIPGGHLEVGGSRLGLRSMGQVESLDELGSIVVRGFPNPVYLRDLARVVDGRAEQTSLARVDGERAVTFDVVKESQANSVQVVHDVHEVLDELADELPAGVSTQVVMDGAEMVRDMYHEMRRALLIGAAMAIMVVYLFLVDWRSTFISAMALPTSVITTFFFLWIAGFSLNLLSLLGLVLVIGILIDDAVVVREVIYRHQEAGEDPVTAAIEGTKEVGLAVLATTLSILAVFIPVGFVGGMIGQFFSEFGLTIAIAVAVSLVIAFTVDPMLSTRISKVVHFEDRSRAGKALIRFWSGVDDAYRSILGWALDHGKSIVGIALVLFLASLVMMLVTPSEFIPKYDRAQFMVTLDLPPATAIEPAEQVAEEVEAILWELDEVEHIYTIVGVDDNPDRIRMRVSVPEKRDRDRSVFEIADEARAAVSRVPGLSVSVTDIPLFEGMEMGSPIEVEIRGEELEAMQELANEIRLGMRAIPGATDIRSTNKPGRPELRLEVDRDKAAGVGASVGQAGILLRMAVAGQVVGTYRDGERSYDIRIRAREEDRTPATLLSSLLLLSPLPRLDDPWGMGTPVALQDIARVGHDTAPATIERHDRSRVLKVGCDLKGRALSEVQRDVQALLDELPRPEGVDVVIAGETEMAQDALGSLLFALGLAIAFVYAVLASQFESFVHPFTIMLSLPLAVVGAFATIFLIGWPIGILPMLGIILLMGLVAKNAILLVDRANQLRAEGVSVREALLDAGHVRLRPILMTTLAMILGMAPAAVATGPGSEIQQPMAVPVIGGLIASTLLTLVVVPVVYQWVENVRERRAARRGGQP